MLQPRRVSAAKWITRCLPEPHETDFEGEPMHQLLATAFADWVCPPGGHSISWSDSYAAADQRPLHHKAALLLGPDGSPRPLPDHLTPQQREVSTRAIAAAERIAREAHRRGLC
jgi:hypothetical protein